MTDADARAAAYRAWHRAVTATGTTGAGIEAALDAYRDAIADALSLIEAERDKLREALVVIEDGEGDAQEIARQTLALHPTDNDHGDGN